MSDGDPLRDVWLTVDLDDPIEDPTWGQLAEQVRRLGDPHVYGAVLERAGSIDPPYIDCAQTRLGWYLTRRGDEPTDVSQGRFASETATLDALLAWARRSEGWRDAQELRPLNPEPFPPIDNEAHHWVRSERAEGRIVYFYELNQVGIALRSVELKGEASIPRAAASLAAWQQCQRGLMQPETPDSRRYRLRFGSVPEGTERDWGNYPHDDITPEEFDEVWTDAREYLRRHPRGVP